MSVKSFPSMRAVRVLYLLLPSFRLPDVPMVMEACQVVLETT